MALDRADAASAGLLVVLYLLQGIPLGLVFGSVPFLLKSKASYSALATFSLASYPYSLKLFWSPFVDTFYLNWLGRRKTWIVPTQLIISAFFLWLSLTGWIDSVLAADDVPVATITVVFFLLVVVAATQDIAVDGWAVSLLSEENKSFASTSQSIGLNTGFFLSFTVLLALESPEFCNKYLRQVPSDHGVLSMGTYMGFWGLVMFTTTVVLLFFKREKKDEDVGNPREVFMQMKQIVQRPPMFKLILFLLIHKIGFSVNDNVTGLKLLEKGFQKEDLALTVVLDFPVQIILGFVIGSWAKTDSLRPWYIAQWARLAVGVVATILVINVPEGGPDAVYFWIVVAGNLVGSSMRSIMFIAQGAYFAQIADPTIAGTYLTLLNTLSNLGGTWHNYFVLQGVDLLTQTECVGVVGGGASLPCGTDVEKEFCMEAKGQCVIHQDGYVLMSWVGTALGVAILYFYVHPTVRYLKAQPKQVWKVAHPP